MTNHVQNIQNLFRERIANPESAILTKEGVYAEINLEEAGLNKAEGSFGGVHPRTWNAYKLSFHPDTTVNLPETPADFENLPAEEVVRIITDFKNWYFQKPPKQDFFTLPSLLWLVACDAAYLAPAPVVSRIQKLVGCETVDGIWGSGTTEKVKSFFAGKTVPDMVQFAMDLTDLIIARYEEMKQYPQHAANVPHWTERAERKLKMLLEFVNRQNELADTGQSEAEVPVNELRQQESPNGGGGTTEQDAEILTEGEGEPEPETIVVPASDLKVLIGAIKEQSKSIYHLVEIANNHSSVMIQFKDALMEHAETQKAMLEQIAEMPAAKMGKPRTPREELNELPDSLVP